MHLTFFWDLLTFVFFLHSNGFILVLPCLPYYSYLSTWLTPPRDSKFPQGVNSVLFISVYLAANTLWGSGRLPIRIFTQNWMSSWCVVKTKSPTGQKLEDTEFEFHVNSLLLVLCMINHQVQTRKSQEQKGLASYPRWPSANGSLSLDGNRWMNREGNEAWRPLLRGPGSAPAQAVWLPVPQENQ